MAAIPAFTAGVLKRLLCQNDIEIVALSGTSGGAVWAMLAWRGLIDKGRADAIARLEGFWSDKTRRGSEARRDELVLNGARVLGEFLSWEVSPYRYESVAAEQLRELLERHCGFVQVPQLLRQNLWAPRLLISAVDVQSGEFSVFRSHDVEHCDTLWLAADFTANVLLASAAVPTLFRAVEIEGRHYWDGVFSQNPPVRELPDLVRTRPDKRPPQEIWIVRINPHTRAKVPQSMADIRDRRNELAGIISLEQELYFIDRINRMVEGRAARQKDRRAGAKDRGAGENDAEAIQSTPRSPCARSRCPTSSPHVSTTSRSSTAVGSTSSRSRRTGSSRLGSSWAIWTPTSSRTARAGERRGQERGSKRSPAAESGSGTPELSRCAAVPRSSAAASCRRPSLVVRAAWGEDPALVPPGRTNGSELLSTEAPLTKSRVRTIGPVVWSAP